MSQVVSVLEEGFADTGQQQEQPTIPLEDSSDLGPPLEERLERLREEVTRHIGRLERGENKHWNEVFHLYYPAGTEDYVSAKLENDGD